MSSFNDSGEYSSQQDSIPIETDPASSASSRDILVDVPEDEEYDNNNSNYSTATPSQLTPSRSGFTPSRSGFTGVSDDYGSTYRSPSEGGSGSYDDEGEFSSGYGSWGYDDSTRSPRSGSEMSSTFASFYYENEFFIRFRHTVSFFRRPLYFALFAVGGSGVAGSVCQAARVLTRMHVDTSGLPSAAGAVRAAPVPTATGYPDLPSWLQEVRASLPVAVEKPALWTLRWYGVPILSEVQRSSQAAAQHISESVQAAKESWKLSGPMIPVGVFLPIFTFLVLRISSRVLAKRHDPSGLYDDDHDEHPRRTGHGSQASVDGMLASTVPARPGGSDVAFEDDGEVHKELDMDDSPPPTARVPPINYNAQQAVELLDVLNTDVRP